MTPVAQGWGSGKLILVGEHAVVHGQPAIAFSVDRGATVELARVDGPTTLHSAIDDALVRRAVDAVVGAEGWDVTITTDLPIGRGMGSSAALSVALVRAADAAAGQRREGQALFDAALDCERIFHANPSGLDVAVSVWGGSLRYSRLPTPTFTPLACPSWEVVVIDSGKVGSTKELVAGVTARRPGIDPLLHRIGRLVHAAESVLDDPVALGPLLDENHALLRQIGVSTDELDAICALARSAGALGAKLSGAGGGGVVLALVDDPMPVLQAAGDAGYEAWTCRPSPRA